MTAVILKAVAKTSLHNVALDFRFAFRSLGRRAGFAAAAVATRAAILRAGPPFNTTSPTAISA
jgi:hypothetical protein